MKTVLICVMTLDGKIARPGPGDLDWSTPADRAFFARETRRMGVVIMGRTTYESIGRPLGGRLNVVLTRTLKGKEGIPGRVEFTAREPAAILQGLEQRGYREAAIVGGGHTNAVFLNAGLIDEMWVSVAPCILGRGVELFDGEHAEVRLEYLSHEMLGAEIILLRYRVKR